MVGIGIEWLLWLGAWLFICSDRVRPVGCGGGGLFRHTVLLLFTALKTFQSQMTAILSQVLSAHVSLAIPKKTPHPVLQCPSGNCHAAAQMSGCSST